MPRRGGLETPRRRAVMGSLDWMWAGVDIHWDCWVGAPYEPLELVEDSGFLQRGYLSTFIFVDAQWYIFVSRVKTQVFYGVLSTSSVSYVLATGLDGILTNICR